MSRTLVIFDWDNTLSPSSRGIVDLERLKKNVGQCISFLDSKENVDVVIVTNSSSRGVYSVLPSIDIPVYSARDQFGETCHYSDWKTKMCQTVVKEKAPDHIIGIGDTDGDIHSVQQAGKIFGLPTKCIQFIPFPTQQQIEVQLGYIVKTFEKIMDMNTKVDLITMVCQEG